MAIYDRYTRETSFIERRRLIVPSEKFEAVSTAYYDDGWRVQSSGAYTNKKMFPKVDASRIGVIIEREIAKP